MDIELKIENDIDEENEEYIIKIYFPTNIKTAHIHSLKLIDDRGNNLEERKSYCSTTWFGRVLNLPAVFYFKMKSFESLYDNTRFSFSAKVNQQKEYIHYQFQLANLKWEQIKE